MALKDQMARVTIPELRPVRPHENKADSRSVEIPSIAAAGRVWGNSYPPLGDPAQGIRNYALRKAAKWPTYIDNLIPFIRHVAFRQSDSPYRAMTGLGRER